MNNKIWYPTELHCHTLHSDGRFSVKELMAAAKKRQLSGIQLTDHNTVSGHAEATDKDLAVLKSIEWTTYFGHMHAVDCKEYVDWRDAVPENIDEKMKAVRSRGGLVGVCHPFQLGTPICTGGRWDFLVRDWSYVSYLEVWSEGHPFMNIPNTRAYEMWHSLLGEGYKIAPTFGRDWHNADNDLCHSACTYLLCEKEILTAEGMKEAIFQGRTVISLGPLFYFSVGDKVVGDTAEKGKHKVSFTVDMSRFKKMNTGDDIKPEKIKIISRGGEEVLQLMCDNTEAEIQLEEKSWYSAELWGRYNQDKNCLLALTAPIYTK